MTEYFRRTRDPRKLLARERAPLTGRRVPKHRSKQHAVAESARRVPKRIPIIAAAAVVALSAIIVAALPDDEGSPSEPGAASESTEASAVLTTAASLSTAVAVTTPPSAEITAPASPETLASVAPTTSTFAATTTAPAAPTIVRLRSATAAAGVTVIPTDPGATATFEGPLPAFNFGVDCMVSGCTYSLRAFSPGAVTSEGLTTVNAVASRFVYSTTSASPCTGSNGTQFAREISTAVDLTVTGSQLVDEVSVPDRITGTLTTIKPDAGYVPRVGEVVDEGAERGCPGQTLIFVIDSPLVPVT